MHCCLQSPRPLLPAGAVGVYVPGGTAVLPSSALMLTVPAQIAGCRTIVLATPPRPDGSITPEVVWAAKKAGVTHVLKAGGAQAVAAMAWGTESCPKVWPGPRLLWHPAAGRIQLLACCAKPGCSSFKKSCTAVHFCCSAMSQYCHC